MAISSGTYSTDKSSWMYSTLDDGTVWLTSAASYIPEKEVKDMRGLFVVYVIDYKNDDVLATELVVAKDSKTAEIKVLAGFANEYDLDDLDIICNKLGDVRKKAEVQKVEIVKGE